MRKLFTNILLIVALVLSSCTYDDTAVWNKLENHESRISALEELCREMNTNILALQSLVNAMQGGDYITSIVPVTKDGNTIGYTITFAENDPITIYHGTNGKDGANGADGKDGADGYTPVIGVKQDSDGIYYWTLDGAWLLDDNGNKIKAVGTDGEDGKDGQDGANGADGTNGNDGANGTDGKDGADGNTPQLKIENGYWYVSYDNGTSWTQLGKATGEDGQDGANGADGKDGDSFFQSVIQDENNVYFTLADGTIITLPKGLALDIVFDESDLVAMSPNSTREIGYTGTSVTESVKVEVTSSADIKAKVVADDESGLTGKIHIITGDAIDEYSKVIVFVSNGDKVIMRSITFEEAGLMVEEDATLYAAAEGGEVALNFLSNVECKVVIPEEAQSWISVVPATRAMERQTITLKLEHNEGYYRSATVTVQSSDGTLKLEYQVEQEGELGVEIDPTQIPDNEIWYTSTDGTIVEPKDGAVSGGTLVSNTYVDGVGIMTFSSDVTALNQDAFNNRDTLKSIILPNSLISIGTSTFYDCDSLERVTIGNSVTSIGYYAFVFCDSLTSVTIPDSVTSIGGLAFYYCTSLTSITIPDSVTTIGDNAFSYCDSLTSVTIPDSVTTIGQEAFSSCTSLTSVTIGNGVTSIGELAFFYCYSLESFYGKFASEDNRCLIVDGKLIAFAPVGLTEYTIPDSVTEIGNSVFDDCSSLRSITIPDSVTSIGNSAFAGCDSLTSLTIPNSVTSIGDYAFAGCDSLTSITIPDSVTAIGEDAFYNCTSLTRVDITDIEAWCKIIFSYSSSLRSNPLVYGSNLYINGELVNELVIPDSVTSIGNFAFWCCASLTSVTIPNSVTEIGYGTFGYCTSLTNVTIPSSVTTIRNNVFQDCSSLTSVTIPDSVTTIGDSAFAVCTSLTSVTIPDSVTWIGVGAFSYCDSLTSITIPDSVTEIGDYAFENCNSLTSVTIPDSVTEIGNYAFQECDSLTSVTIPDSVTKIGDGAFSSCESLTSVYCKLTTPPSLGEDAFKWYDGSGNLVNIGCTIYVPTASVEAYKSAAYWSDYKNYIVGYNF